MSISRDKKERYVSEEIVDIFLISVLIVLYSTHGTESKWYLQVDDIDKLLVIIYFFSSVNSGILVPGGFGIRGTEGKILAANWARTKNVPYLGRVNSF